MPSSLRLKVKIRPGYLEEKVLRSKVYDVFVDELLDLADRLQKESYVGATGQLNAGWDVIAPRRETVTFDVVAKVTNDSAAAINRIAGREPGGSPPIAPLTDWVQVKIEPDPKKARRLAYVIGRAIAARGTKRYQTKQNFVGLNLDGSLQPNSPILETEKRIAQKLQEL